LDAVLAEFKIEPDAGLVLVPVLVEGKPRQFLIDTGSTLSLFDSSLSSGAPLAQIAVSPPSGSAVEKGLYAVPKASVGGIDMRGSGPVMYHDFSALRAVSDRDVWGLLGMQFLKKFIVQVDLASGTVRFLDRAAPPSRSWGVPVPMKIDQRGIPAVTGVVKGQPVEFELDTGDNSGGNLAFPLFARLFPRKKKIRGEDLMFTGVTSSPSGRLKSLSIGGLKFSGLVFESANDSSLGLALARRCAITFDFPRGAVYLKPGKHIAVAQEFDMSGLHVLRQEGRIAVVSVDVGSPAEAAGVRRGDFVAGVPGHPEVERDIVALRRLLSSGDGVGVALSIEREGGVRPITLKLKKSL
jgi:hypothetical protein